MLPDDQHPRVAAFCAIINSNGKTETQTPLSLPCDGLDIVVRLCHLAEPVPARNQVLKRGLRLLRCKPNESLLVAVGQTRRVNHGGVCEVQVGVPAELCEVVGAKAVSRQFLAEEADDLDLGNCG